MEDRILIPADMRSEMIDRLLARDIMFWPNMTTNIKNRISNCDVCIRPMQTHAIPKLPFNRVTMDVLEIRDKERGKKHYFLVTADHFSDFFELDEIKSTSAQHIIHATKKNFARHGIPEICDVDNAIANKEMTKFCNTWNVQLSYPHQMVRPNLRSKSQNVLSKRH